jgi:hypothetical protein
MATSGQPVPGSNKSVEAVALMGAPEPTVASVGWWRAPAKKKLEVAWEWIGTIALFLVGLGLVLITSEPIKRPIAGYVHADKWSWGFEALIFATEHLGVVIMVAMLVRVAIERASQKQFLDLVNSEVRTQVKDSIRQISVQEFAPLEKSIKTLDDRMSLRITREEVLDPGSIEVLKEKVLNPSFIRTEYHLNLTLEPLPAGANRNDFLLVRSRTDIQIKNITEESASFPVHSWVDNMFMHSDPNLPASRFTFFASGPQARREEFENRPFGLDNLLAKGEILEDNGGLFLRHKIDEIDSGETYFVVIESTQAMRKQDLFVWNLTGLTLKFTVSVQFKGLDAEKFTVDARELHHIDSGEFSRSKKSDKGVLSWAIDQVLLPYQGVEVWWWSNRDTAAAAGQQAAAKLEAASAGARAVDLKAKNVSATDVQDQADQDSAAKA